MITGLDKSLRMTTNPEIEFQNEEEYLDGLKLIEEGQKTFILEDGSEFDLIKGKQIYEEKFTGQTFLKL